jgi:hypothetical protein
MGSTTVNVIQKVSMADLALRPDFKGLTFGQQEFIRVYLSTGGDAKSGVLAAFPLTADKNIRTRISHIMSQPTVRRLIEIASGVSERDSILAEVGDAIRKSMRHDLKGGGSLSIASKDLIKFFVEQLGQPLTRADESVDGSQKYAIGSLIRQNGKVFRVIAQEVEEDGI